MSERFLAIIYLIFAQTLPLTICLVFDKFFLRFLRFGEKNECSSVWLHQPKSLFETCLLVVKDSTIRRENIRLKTELEKKTKDELKATKDKMRKTIFNVDTIRNNDKLCKHYTGFGFCHNFSHFIAPYRFLWVFQGNTEEMKHASLVVSTIITVLALVKTCLLYTSPSPRDA